MTTDERDQNAAACAKLQLMQDFGEVFTDEFLERVARSAVLGAREVIEDEQRVKDAAIAMGESVTAESEGITSVTEGWQRSEYGALAAEDILRASPSYDELRQVLPRQEELPAPYVEPSVVQVSTRRVRTASAPVFRPEAINPVVNGMLVSESDILRGAVPAHSSLVRAPMRDAYFPTQPATESVVVS